MQLECIVVDHIGESECDLKIGDSIFHLFLFFCCEGDCPSIMHDPCLQS